MEPGGNHSMWWPTSWPVKIRGCSKGHRAVRQKNQNNTKTGLMSLKNIQNTQTPTRLKIRKGMEPGGNHNMWWSTSWPAKIRGCSKGHRAVRQKNQNNTKTGLMSLKNIQNTQTPTRLKIRKGMEPGGNHSMWWPTSWPVKIRGCSKGHRAVRQKNQNNTKTGLMSLKNIQNTQTPTRLKIRKGMEPGVNHSMWWPTSWPVSMRMTCSWPAFLLVFWQNFRAIGLWYNS